MSIVPVGDCEIIVLSPEQFGALMNEDRKVARPAARPLLGALQPWNTPAPSMLSTSLPWNRGTASPRPRPDPITGVNPLAPIDRTNEWLKDNTYVDMFGWKDVVSDGRSAVKQVMLLGIMGDAYLARTRAGKEAVIFRGRPGLRARLPGTRYLRAHPIVKEAGFVIGRKEALEEAGRAVRIAVICFVAWDIAHELLQDKPSMTRLGVSIVSDIFQAVAATYIGWIAGTAIAMVFVDGIIITFIAVSGASFFAGMGMSIFDSQFHVTKKALELAKTIDISKVIDSFVDFSNRINKNYILSHRSAYTYFSY